MHLTNLYHNIEFENRLSKPKEHRITSKDRAEQARPRETTAFARLLSYSNRSTKSKVQHVDRKQQRSSKRTCLLYSPMTQYKSAPVALCQATQNLILKTFLWTKNTLKSDETRIQFKLVSETWLFLGLLGSGLCV